MVCLMGGAMRAGEGREQEQTLLAVDLEDARDWFGPKLPLCPPGHSTSPSALTLDSARAYATGICLTILREQCCPHKAAHGRIQVEVCKPYCDEGLAPC